MTEFRAAEVTIRPTISLHKPDTVARWDKTRMAISNMKHKGFFEEGDGWSKNGYFLGRRIIGRDTAIRGGVYIGAGDREAIVVDDKHVSSELNRVYDSFINQRQDMVRHGRKFKEGLLEDVFEMVKKELPYDAAKVAKINKDEGLGDNRKVSLDFYIRQKAGVCRHQALLGAYILERLAKEGRIRGKVSVDRNFIPGQGGHAWIRYRTGEGKIVIIDPAQDYIGHLDDVSDNRWFYERPTDRGLLGLIKRATNRM